MIAQKHRSRRSLADHLECRRLFAAIAVGGTVSGQIGAAGETDSYTFSAQAGQKYFLSFATLDIDTGFGGRIQIVDPSSATLDTVAEGASRQSFTVATTGTVTLNVYDVGQDDRGNYDIGLERSTGNSDDAIVMEPGKIVTGQIGGKLITNQHYFDVVAGNSYLISFHTADIDSGFGGRIAIFDSNGALLDTIAEGASNSRLDISSNTRLTLHVYDVGTDDRGDYKFSFTSLKPDWNDAQAIATRQTIYGSISGSDELDQYVVPLGASQQVSLQLLTTDIDAGFGGRIAVYNPSTGVVTTVAEGATGSFTASAAGDYVFIVYDVGTDDRGDYGLVVNGLDPVKAYRNTLYVSGTSAVNTINVTASGGKYIVSLDGANTEVNQSAATLLDIRSFDGDDKINYGTLAINSNVQGGTGNDLITGGSGRDTITGGGGRNTLFGGDGDDRLSGSSGRDLLAGQGGSDRLYGNAGNDTLDGGSGTDRLYGGLDNDLLIGGASNDRIYGDLGDDTLFGNAGNDLLAGDGGSDRAYKVGTDIITSCESVVG